MMWKWLMSRFIHLLFFISLGDCDNDRLRYVWKKITTRFSARSPKLTSCIPSFHLRPLPHCSIGVGIHWAFYVVLMYVHVLIYIQVSFGLITLIFCFFGCIEILMDVGAFSSDEGTQRKWYFYLLCIIYGCSMYSYLSLSNCISITL